VSSRPGRRSAAPSAPPQEPSDEVLARRAGLGDRDAFAAIVNRHGPALYRYAIRLLDNPADAQDAVQEAFIGAWRGLGGYRGDAGLRTWLFTLLRRKAYSRLTRFPASGSRPYITVDEAAGTLADRSGDPAALHSGAALLAALDAALRMLPERQRSAWILRQVEELTYAQIALILAISPDAVRGLLERARTGLAITLKEWR
jgi:RNA polymerase sigma-70 factor (ECF subfamily)